MKPPNSGTVTFRSPEYLVHAAEEYKAAGTHHAAATIALATAATHYCREVGQGLHGPLTKGTNPQGVVRRTLIHLTSDAGLASRFLDIDALADRLEKNGIKLDRVGIKAQGVLYGLVAAAKRIPDDRLRELVDDAGSSTIREFRDKWNTRRSSATSAKRAKLSVTLVVAWVEVADLAEVQRVRDAADTRLSSAVKATA